MLLATVLLWALNLTVTRYILTHGFEPLAYATFRYGLATAIFIAIVLVGERTLRIARADLLLVAVAAFFIFLNQLAFVYALQSHQRVDDRAAARRDTGVRRADRARSRARAALAALLDRGCDLVRRRRPRRHRRASDVSGDRIGILLGLATAATWAAYSVAVAPLMERYSASRISAVALGARLDLHRARRCPADVEQDYDARRKVWVLLAFATLGPLVLTTMLWFRSLHRIGASRATLVANLQPFVAAVFAVVLLDESMTLVQVVGGALIAGGILAARRRPPAPASE